MFFFALRHAAGTGDHDIARIDAASGQPVQWYPDPNRTELECFNKPTDVKIVPSGRFAITANCGAGDVWVTDLQTHASTQLRYDFGAQPCAVATTLMKAGNFALVVDAGSGAHSGTANVLRVHHVSNIDELDPAVFQGQAVDLTMPCATGPPCAVAVAPDGAFALLGCKAAGDCAGAIYRIALPSLQVTECLPENSPDIDPVGLAIDPQGKFALFTGRNATNLGRIDLTGAPSAATLSFPHGGFRDPRGIVIPSQGGYALVADCALNCVMCVEFAAQRTPAEDRWGKKMVDGAKKELAEASQDVEKLKTSKAQIEEEAARTQALLGDLSKMTLR